MSTPKDLKTSTEPVSAVLSSDEQTQESFPQQHVLPETPAVPNTQETDTQTFNRRGGDRRASANLREEHIFQLEQEDRRLRSWLIKALVSCFCIVFVIVIIGMVYSSTTKGTAINDSVLKNFLDTLMEILKVLKPDKPA